MGNWIKLMLLLLPVIEWWRQHGFYPGLALFIVAFPSIVVLSFPESWFATQLLRNVGLKRECGESHALYNIRTGTWCVIFGGLSWFAVLFLDEVAGQLGYRVRDVLCWSL